MKKPRRLVPAYLAAFAISIYLLPQDHAVAETLQVNGFEMHYKIIGKGEPLVLLHGFTASRLQENHGISFQTSSQMTSS